MVDVINKYQRLVVNESGVSIGFEGCESCGLGVIHVIPEFSIRVGMEFNLLMNRLNDVKSFMIITEQFTSGQMTLYEISRYIPNSDPDKLGNCLVYNGVWKGFVPNMNEEAVVPYNIIVSFEFIDSALNKSNDVLQKSGLQLFSVEASQNINDIVKIFRYVIFTRLGKWLHSINDIAVEVNEELGRITFKVKDNLMFGGKYDILYTALNRNGFYKICSIGYDIDAFIEDRGAV